MGPYAPADRAERTVEILVVAWDGFCLNLLSRDDGTDAVCREATDDDAGLGSHDGRAGYGDDGLVRILSGRSPSCGGRAVPTTVEWNVTLPVCHGDSWKDGRG